MTSASFQTRARTIDHLGRGQIADAPTAISELWKNAYDAYARNVSLHLFPGAPYTAAIFDDGVGMDRDDILQRWLVVGTESKVEEEDRGSGTAPFGLTPRPRQGEKGIGRLSVAFLAPVTLLVSRKAEGSFVAVLVDWRLFENPFLSLEDVKVPVDEFADAAALAAGLPAMASTITGNLGGGRDDRTKRMQVAWTRYGEHEARQGLPSTAAAIAADWEGWRLDARLLDEWPVFVGLGGHGTAMFMIGVNHELNVWVRPEASDEIEAVKEKLTETLTGFTDPFAEPPPQFDYEAWVHRAEGPNTRIVAASDVFGADGLHGLEHYVDGAFDEDGVFTGEVVAFGEHLGEKTVRPPAAPPKGRRESVGAFKFCIGTFEQDLRRSTFEAERHAVLSRDADKYGGVTVYRDDLRVMPYGREDADFLGIESRRSRHAGRYFWAHRRSFGRIAFTRGGNPNLKDKAGREGLIENRAKRELRFLVTNVLVQAAALYFGSDSELRKTRLPDIMARNAAAKLAAEKARTARRRGIRTFLKEQKDPLASALTRVEALFGLAESAEASGDRIEATVLSSRYRDMLAGRDALRPPVVASKLGDLEDEYRTFRDNYTTYTSKLEDAGRRVAAVEASIGLAAPAYALEASFERQERTVAQRIEGYTATIATLLEALRGKWAGTAAEDAGALRARYGQLVRVDLEAGALTSAMNVLDAARAEVEEEVAGRFLPFIGALRQLVQGIDFEGAFAATEDERADLEERLRELRGVAQVGVTVEIIGHELETLDAEVRRNLAKLPAAVREEPAYRAAMTSYLALADRLRFLAPMKIGGYRARERITGAQIADYVVEFFGRIFKDQRIDFEATPAFRSIVVTDIPSRIYPVFLNLVNNAVYWVTRRADRRIALDLSEGLVIVADSGPGVDVDDVPRLFDLFFTKRRAGRGIGLHLSRANLDVAGHTIRYAGEGDPRILDGANFIIEFKGLKTDG